MSRKHFSKRAGASHYASAPDGRIQFVSIDASPEDGPHAELVYLDPHDRDDDDEAREALSRLLMSLVNDLPEPHRSCVSAYFFETRGIMNGVKQGVDSGFRQAARRVGTNPVSGKPIDKKTVAKYVQLGVDMLRERIMELPEWQRDIVARALVAGALDRADGTDLAIDSLPPSFPGGLSV